MDDVAIALYTWATPNGRKVSIMLEECALRYSVHPVNIGAGEQFEPEFQAINPNAKIPAIVDPAGADGKPITLFESGAILVYLALAREYTIADIATYPWVARHEWQQVDLADFPNVERWYTMISRRPAVVRGMAVPTPP
jgi:glutathione S-transferase